ncbi:MAG TPA: hypothetical protein VNT99_19045, partial [Methylomirabilota bacterium]|nr:hypothetical protein [Methylomirabilota bacterium]
MTAQKKLRNIGNFSVRFGILCSILVCVGGCFHAEDKFYADNDVVIDKRFEGEFLTSTNSDSASILIEKGTNNHYVATYQEGTNWWMKLDAVFFRAGTNLFVDISRISDSGGPPDIRGPRPPNTFELLQLATGGNTHSAFRIQLFDDAIETQIAWGNMAFLAVQQEPTIKGKILGEGAFLLTNSTDQLHSFLTKIG